MRQFSIRKMMLGVVVLAIASALIAIWDRAKARGREAQCEQQLHEVGFAVLGYLHSHSAFPPGTWPNPDLAPEDRISLWGPLSPYLDQQLWFDVAQSEAWNHAGINDEVSRLYVHASACSEATRPATGKLQPMSYIAIAGVGADAPLVPKRDPRAGVFGYDRQTTLADIKDGAATTMMIAETTQAQRFMVSGRPGNRPRPGPSSTALRRPRPAVRWIAQRRSVHRDGRRIGSLDRRFDYPEGVRSVVDNRGRRESACGLVIIYGIRLQG